MIGKILKTLFFVIALVLVVVLVGLSFGGPIIAPIVAGQIEGVLKTDVSLKSVSVNLLQGRVGLKGLEVSNPAPFSDENLLELGKLKADISIRNLLSKKVVVSFVDVSGVKVHIEKKMVGEAQLTNVEKLVADLNEGAEEKAPAEPTTKDTSEAESSEAMPFTLKSFKLSDTQLTYWDVLAGKQKFEVKDIDVDFKNFQIPAPGKTLSETLNISALLGSTGKFSLNGKSLFAAEKPEFDYSFDLVGTSLSDFNLFLSNLPFEFQGGALSVSSQSSVLQQMLKSNSVITLEEVKTGVKKGVPVLKMIPYKGMLAALTKNKKMQFEVPIEKDLSSGKVNVWKLVPAAVLDALNEILLGNITGVTGDAIGAAGNLAEGTVNVAADAAEETIGAAAKVADGALGVVSDATGGVLDGPTGVVSKAGEGVTDVAAEGVEQTKKMAKKLTGLFGGKSENE